jgi:hypothetical protein
MTKLTSFQADIRPLFTERDIEGMQKGFNLASYMMTSKHTQPPSTTASAESVAQ